MSDDLSFDRVPDMSEADAREVARRHAASVIELERLLAEARNREAWRALGYATWAEFVVAELPQYVRWLDRVAEADPVDPPRTARVDRPCSVCAGGLERDADTGQCFSCRELVKLGIIDDQTRDSK
jgi:hypothetical protein